MTNKKELNEKEIDKVNGGKRDGYEDITLPHEKNPIEKDEAAQYIGREVVILSTKYVFAACGTLIASYEKSSGCGSKWCVKLKLNTKYVPYYGDQDEFYVDKASNLRAYLMK